MDGMLREPAAEFNAKTAGDDCEWERLISDRQIGIAFIRA